ncbi:MAG: ribosome biogenesis protein [Nanoarchaeota archaeon]|nr:ribosome biogenesis protein [Nanoarchaeota archaeon]
MKILHCPTCRKYTLKNVCACKTKTRTVSYKFKQPKYVELTIKSIKENADKKRI